MASQQDDIAAMLSQFGQQPELSIVKLSEPVLAPDAGNKSQLQWQDENQRSSDVSSGDTNDNPTPASLQADLEHYKELFTKLRFSYVEQVTKEKFLRFVVGDPPFYVTAQENTDLEYRLSSAKQALKAQKELVADMIAELERQARELSGQNQDLQVRVSQLKSLPDEIEQFKRAIADLAAAQEPLADNPFLGLPLHSTVEILGRKEAELAELEQQLADLDEADARKSQQLGQLEYELKPLIDQKNDTVVAAKEARARKDNGVVGVEDELEERGRWLLAVESTMNSLLQAHA